MSILNKLKLKKEKEAPSQKESVSVKPSEKISPRTNFEGSARDFLIKKVWMTERANLILKQGKYVFVVKGEANKSEVKKAVQSKYGVRVSSVHIVNSKGKSKRLGRSIGKTSDFKKAIVSLKPGQKIDAIGV